MVKKYTGGEGAAAERGWVISFLAVSKGWVVQFSATHADRLYYFITEIGTHLKVLILPEQLVYKTLRAEIIVLKTLSNLLCPF